MRTDRPYDPCEGGPYMRPSHYPPGYREDEELYVYDQCCGNCSRCPCPLEEDEYDSTMQKRLKEKMRREDGVFRSGSLVWCIHWKGGR